MKKRLIVTVCLLSMSVFWLTGCGGNNSTAQNNTTTEDTAGQGQDEAGLGTEDSATDETGTGEDGESDFLGNYQTMLQGAGSQEDIYSYIDTNISGATSDEADQVVTGLIGHVGSASSIDYTRLQNHKSYMSDEMGRFIDLMQQEQETPAVTMAGGNQLSVTELLNRAAEFENLMNDYPDGATNQYAYERYEQIMKAAITGGYDAQNNVVNSYLDDKQTLGENYLTEYNDFIGGEQSGTRTAEIVSDYVGMFGDDRKMTDDISAYYNNFMTNLKDAFTGTNTETGAGTETGADAGTETGTN